ncbi:type II toxin-antitoxin system TacA family antitoxin [Mesorhizobium sp. PL10]
MTNMAPLSVRVTPDERDILEAAASQANTNLSDFIRRKAVEAAEMEVLDSRIVTIPAADWEKFEEWAKSPPRSLPGLRKLAASKPVWQD